MISVVIPAHDEVRVIGRCLETLLGDARTDELEVIVVCNGCTDDTAGLAASFGERVRVIESERPSKTHALNLGNEAARGEPRVYLDADIAMTAAAVRAVAERLAQGDVFAVAPRMHVDLTDRSWGVRAFYRVWLTLPYCREGLVGSGVYALSRVGRERVGEFPDIISDDGYARLHFPSAERAVVQDCEFTVLPPTSLWGVVKIKTRAHLGNMELKAKHPELYLNEEARHGMGLAALLRDPRWWPAVTVYSAVRLVARYRATRQAARGSTRWERDDSSRDGVDQ